MEDRLIYYFQEYEHFAILISIGISIIVAVLGVIPSFFVTAANLIFFGFWMGTFISFVGESLGAIIAFYLYRKGFKQFSQKPLDKYPKLKRLVHVKGKDAFYLILSLRLLPFVPSGLVTLAGAIGSVSFITFAIASSIGKIPALLIEAYSVYQITQFEWQGKMILSIAAIYLIFVVWKKRKQPTSV
jgi:uncharacterized membrane protein YdjX (TVP38/TMEM64 family)